jgi:hypothetical protein
MKKSLKFRSALLIVLFFLLFTISQTFGATRTVCSSGATYTSIQSAIDAANNGDTISICDGTYNERNIQITKNNLTIMGASGNRDNVIINRSGGNIFVIQAANATIKNLTIVSSTYGIRDNYQASGSHTFENLSFNTSDTSIYLSHHADACTFKNLDITTNISGIYLAWNIDGAHTFQDITISARYYYGIYTARGAGSFSNVTITSGNTGIHLGSKYLATFDTISVKNSAGYGINLNSTENYSYNHTFKNLSIDSYDTGLYVEKGKKVTVKDSTITSSAGYGIYFASAVDGANEFSNVTISSYYSGIYCLSGLALLEDFNITSQALYGIQIPNDQSTIIHRGTIASRYYSIYITSGSSESVTIEDVSLSSQNSRGIYLVACSSALINRVCITKATEGIYTEWNAQKVTITNTKISDNSGNGVSIHSNSSSRNKATVTNNCFLTSPFAYRNSAAHNFTGNYWNGIPPNGYDSAPLSSCPVSSCYVASPSTTANYRMDECSWRGTVGEVKDSSGSDYNATAKSANDTNLSKLSNQIINNGALFTRTNQQYVQLPTLQVDKPNFNDGFTVTTWAKFSGTPGSWERIFDFGRGENQNNIFLGRYGTSNNLVLGIHEGTAGEQYLTATGAISDTNWHFWAVTCSGPTCALYKDGVNIASSSTMKIPSNVTRTQNYIGKSNWSVDDYLEGGIDEFKVFDESLSATQISDIYTYESTKKNYDGTERSVIVCDSICRRIKEEYATTSDGYYYVNEAIANESNIKPFEIYCEGMNTDSISQYLPTVINESNSDNSNFKFNAIVNSKYYTSPDKTYFKKIEVDSNLSAIGDILQGFSSINLIGTPFQIDLDNTTLGTCDSASDFSKLRIGHYNQAVKIDPTVETKNYCTASKMPFKQIPNYYAKDAYKTYTTCAEVAKNASERPPSGYYLLKKPKIVANEGKYVVAYCEMNPPIKNQIWTIFLALDGQTTDKKSDVVNGDDTCSRIGYSFFTPNQRSVMEAARSFLYDRKSEWSDYTGSVKEYFDDYGISGWATNDSTSVYKPNPIPNGPMWPYGPFGIYKPSNGGSGNKKMAMSTNYLSMTDKDDDFGSLAEEGWKSVLPEINSAYEDKWWVADIAAGYARNADGHLERIDASIEPNGDYDANNWMGWFADANGYIIHYNDQNGNNKYRYSNYMCTSQDMYKIVDTSIWNTWGFDAWDTTKSISLRTISTKKVNKGFDLRISSLNNTGLATQAFKGTVCVRIVDDQNISYNGAGAKLYFNNEQSQILSNINISQAIKDARVLLSWKKDVDTTCPLVDSNSTLATDNFAIRPLTFNVSLPTSAYAGEDFTLDFKAVDGAGNSTPNYNETKGDSFVINSTIGKVGCTNGTFNIADFSFIDGYRSVDANYTDVGDIAVTIKEILGNEFAKIDASDTSDTDRLIAPITQTITVAPYELNVTDANFTASTNQNWLYDANVSDMNVTASATVQANNAQHNAVQNFTANCYAKNVNVTFYYDFNNTNVDANISYIPTSLGIEHDFTDINKTITIPSTDFIAPNASTKYSFNVNRVHYLPFNPISIELKDVNVTTTDVAKIENNATINSTKNFYYGRIVPTDIRTNQTPVNHSSSIQVFVDANWSQKANWLANGHVNWEQKSINWYQMRDDNITPVINFTPKADFTFATNKAGITSITPTQGTNMGRISFVLANTWGRSDNVYIHLDIPNYLWFTRYQDSDYNSTGNCATHPCFRYIFYQNNSLNNIHSGDFNASNVSDRNYTRGYEKAGVKTFR